MVEELKKEGASLRNALNAVGMAKSSYYYKEKKRKEKPLNTKIVEALRELEDYELVYGYRKITHWLLKKKGIKANRKAVLRHMQKLKMTQPRKIKGPKIISRLTHGDPISSNMRWEGDLTYVWGGKDGQCYLFAFVDCYDNEIVGDLFTQRCRAKDAVGALRRAIKYRFPNGCIPEGHRLIIRVDRGTQFIAREFMEEARKMGVSLEFCGLRCPDDKPNIESFFSMYKKEEVYRNEYENYEQAESGWYKFKQWYNKERFNEGLDYLTPTEMADIGIEMFKSKINHKVSLIGASF